MVENQPITFQRATPVLLSGDDARSRTLYVDILGFQVVEEGGDPAKFGIFQRGSAILFVDAWSGAATHTPGTWNAYVHVSGLAGLLAEVEAKDITITRPLEDTPYGMCEFDVADPDGNIICFGEDSDLAEKA